MSASAELCEVRATWVHAWCYENDAVIAQSLDKMRRANLNTLFAISPRTGFEPDAGPDGNYAKFIAAAKSMEFAVHGWIINMARKGRGSQAEFTVPAEREIQAKWPVRQIELYPELDGVHFDYIRYDDFSEGVNNQGKLDAVTEAVAGAHQALKERYPSKLLTAAVFVSRGAFADWDKENIPAWFRDWMKSNPGNIYQKHDPPQVPVFFKYQQDPVTWVKDGIVDAIQPMEYTISDEEWFQDADSWQSFLGDNMAKVQLGLGYLTEEGTDYGYDEAGICRKIKHGRSRGASGFSIFQLLRRDKDESDLIRALTTDCEDNEGDAPCKTRIPSLLLAEG
jgi:hypothetical protein